MDKAEKAQKALSLLDARFPGAAIALEFSTPLELLVATILSAQATDALVNRVTRELFGKYRSAKDYASSPPGALEKDVSSINFFRNKAKSIRAAAAMILADFKGKVPDTLDDLVRLPGVGRKTANIVLAEAYGKDALAVDTHVKRVANRIGLVKSEDPDEIEAELCGIVPKKRWTDTTRLFIIHGRNICKAKKPLCPECPVNSLCDYYKAASRGLSTGPCG